MALTEDLMGLGMPWPLAAALTIGTLDFGSNNPVFKSAVFQIQGTTAINLLNSSAQTSVQISGSTNNLICKLGSLVFETAAGGIQLQSGANGRTGTFTMNGATPVVVGNTSLAAGDMIVIERDTIGGTPGAYNLTARSNGTSFSVTGTAGDTSGMRYFLIRIN